jgi:NADH dehydrogenase/NADH:ubiquinone oxidoreductase subunit G
MGITPEEAGFSEEDLRNTEYAVLAADSSPLSEKASVLLPLLPWPEKEGTTVNLEGRELAVRKGPLSKKTGRTICDLLARAALPSGGKIPSNPVVR